jgi:hypothetical protein
MFTFIHSTIKTKCACVTSEHEHSTPAAGTPCSARPSVSCKRSVQLSHALPVRKCVELQKPCVQTMNDCNLQIPANLTKTSQECHRDCVGSIALENNGQHLGHWLIENKIYLQENV